MQVKAKQTGKPSCLAGVRTNGNTSEHSEATTGPEHSLHPSPKKATTPTPSIQETHGDPDSCRVRTERGQDHSGFCSLRLSDTFNLAPAECCRSPELYQRMTKNPARQGPADAHRDITQEVRKVLSVHSQCNSFSLLMNSNVD